jgi:hypothetical protein
LFNFGEVVVDVLIEFEIFARSQRDILVGLDLVAELVSTCRENLGIDCQ